MMTSKEVAQLYNRAEDALYLWERAFKGSPLARKLLALLRAWRPRAETKEIVAIRNAIREQTELFGFRAKVYGEPGSPVCAMGFALHALGCSVDGNNNGCELAQSLLDSALQMERDFPANPEKDWFEYSNMERARTLQFGRSIRLYIGGKP